MIGESYFWINILLLAVGTLAIRGSIIAISHRIEITDRWKEIFSFIPAAILPGFIAPAVFFHHGSVDWLLGKERLVVLIGATVVSYFFRSILLTIGFGLVALYFLTTL